MSFLALGVEHKTSPLDIREAATMDRAAVSQASADLLAHPAIHEVAILSTCNRTEIYLYAADSTQAAAAAAACLAAREQRLASYLQTWEEMDAVEHLFRVASGLESRVLGEPQILSQVRETLDAAQQLGTVGANLHSLFRSAIACARQARAGTALGRVQGSVGTEAVRRAAEVLGTLADRVALVIGGGVISRLVAEELRACRVATLIIANRTESVAVDLAKQYHGQQARLADLPTLIPRVDLIISATSAPHYVLTREDIPADINARPVPLPIFDLAVPRDVDPAVGSLPGVALHDLDGLLPAGLEDHWMDDIRGMEGIIAAEVKEFGVWYLTRRVAPVIANLRSHVEAVSEQELRRVGPQLTGLTDRERAAVESLTHRLIDKMFHHLVTRLRLAAQSDPSLVEAAEFFFLHGEGGLFEHAARLGVERTGGQQAESRNA